MSQNSPVQPDVSAIKQAVQQVIPSVLTDLYQLIRIPSVSAVPHNPAVEESAKFTAKLFKDLGAEVEILRAGGAPAVVANFAAQDPQVTLPRILLYAHHDVQPEGKVSLWQSDPYEPEEREGRLYARGAADDKAGIAVHLAALRAFNGKPPVPVTIFVEGEEEIGSPSLIDFLDKYQEKLDADVIVIADSVNWEVGIPSLTVSLRGMTDCVVEVSTLERGIHSGMFGGAIPDALTALCRILATLHDAEGNVAVKGIESYPVPDSVPVYPTERLRKEAGLLPEAGTIGSKPHAEHMWFNPSITVLAIESPEIELASNTLLASARAKISLRVPPGVSAQMALNALEKHLHEHSDWPVKVTVEPGKVGESFVIDAQGPLYDAARAALTIAWGVPPVDSGIGGSIPFIAELAKRFPEATIFVTGVEDPYSGAHGPNESLHLAEFSRAAEAEALFISALAHLK